MGVMTAEDAPPDAAEAAQDAAPVLGEVVVGTIDGTRVLRWTLGTGAVVRGLTIRGIAAAAAATGRYLDGLNPRAVARSPVVLIRPHEWAVPLVPSDAAMVEAMMTEVVNAPGSIGQLP